MELYVSRAGAVEGPYPTEKIQGMLRDGLLQPADLGAAPGAADWSPLSQLIDCGVARPVSRAVPPPVPADAGDRYLDQPFLVDGRVLTGTYGKSVRRIVDEIAQGGRFVVYPYVFSIVVMSFRRNSPITYIPPGQSNAGGAFGWSLISMCVGWWGIPWGLIFTIGALWRNSGGGVDVTEPILAQIIGPAQADALIRRRPKHRSGALLAMRMLIFSPLLVFPLLIVLVSSSATERERERAKQPGYSALRQAESFVSHPGGASGRGNTAEATKAAELCAGIMKTFRSTAISGKSGKASDGNGITVWCEAHPDRCLFIIEVQDLRRFTDEAKDAFAEASWLAAQLCARTLALDSDAELSIALKGSVLYDRQITGTPVAGLNIDARDSEEVLKKAIKSKKKGGGVQDNLIHFFAPPAP